VAGGGCGRLKFGVLSPFMGERDRRSQSMCDEPVGVKSNLSFPVYRRETV
jgi:hypothetical protein